MIVLPDTDLSYWEASSNYAGYPKLDIDIEIDVVIIGGGIAGLSAAYLLKKTGKRVIVVEKDTIGSGVSNNTTGKVTSQHNLIYNQLMGLHGEQHATSYGSANQAAIKQINKIIIEENIECDWQQDDHYVYTTEDKKVNELQKEASVAGRLGLPASFETQCPLPFEIKGAVHFKNQARFHIKKYLAGLARAIDGNGSYVFEQTRANITGLRDGKLCSVQTNGGNITAKQIIVATNVPYSAGSRGSYCVSEYPSKSYIIAGKPNRKVKGMYISPDNNHYSIMPFGKGTESLVLVGGEGHIYGFGGRQATRYKRLAAYSQEHFGVQKIEYRWSARDYMSYDCIPLIGKLYPWSKNIYVSTAFMKWGLTNATVGAMILRDIILGQANPWAETFNSMRLKPVKSIPRVFAEHIGLK